MRRDKEGNDHGQAGEKDDMVIGYRPGCDVGDVSDDDDDYDDDDEDDGDDDDDEDDGHCGVAW